MSPPSEQKQSRESMYMRFKTEFVVAVMGAFFVGLSLIIPLLKADSAPTIQQIQSDIKDRTTVSDVKQIIVEHNTLLEYKIEQVQKTLDKIDRVVSGLPNTGRLGDHSDVGTGVKKGKAVVPDKKLVSK